MCTIRSLKLDLINLCCPGQWQSFIWAIIIIFELTCPDLFEEYSYTGINQSNYELKKFY